MLRTRVSALTRNWSTAGRSQVAGLRRRWTGGTARHHTGWL